MAGDFNSTGMGLAMPQWQEGALAQNAAEFGQQLVRLANFHKEQTTAIIKKAVIDLYARVMERTPIDTGRARAGWHLTTDGNSAFVPPDMAGNGFSDIKTRGRAKGSATAAEVRTSRSLVGLMQGHVEGFDFRLEDGVVWLINNVEYIEALENGHSRQAPQGMVSLSLAEFNAHFASYGIAV